jgi:hypothetical protein
MRNCPQQEASILVIPSLWQQQQQKSIDADQLPCGRRKGCLQFKIPFSSLH